MVEIFKTDIQSKRVAKKILKQLKDIFPNDIISLDLEDCDKILRVESNHINVTSYLKVIKEMGFFIEALED